MRDDLLARLRPPTALTRSPRPARRRARSPCAARGRARRHPASPHLSGAQFQCSFNSYWGMRSSLDQAAPASPSRARVYCASASGVRLTGASTAADGYATDCHGNGSIDHRFQRWTESPGGHTLDVGSLAAGYGYGPPHHGELAAPAASRRRRAWRPACELHTHRRFGAWRGCTQLSRSSRTAYRVRSPHLLRMPAREKPRSRSGL